MYERVRRFLSAGVVCSEGDCSLAVQHIDQIKKQNEELVTSFGELERKHHQHTQVQ